MATPKAYTLALSAPFGGTRPTLTALDIPTEWYLDTEAGVLYLWTPDGRDPASWLVEVKQRPYAFHLDSRSHIEVRGFGIFSAAIVARGSDHITIDHCDFQYSHHATENEGYELDPGGTNVSVGSHNEWKNCRVAYCAGEGIRLRGDNGKVTNCIIHDVNSLAGHYAAISMEGQGHEIRRNTLYNSGRSLLMHYFTRDSMIELNHMYGAGYLTDDCGITYCWNTDGEGTTIAFNWLHDIRGSRSRWTAGIYLDDGSRNHVLHHNVTWRTPDAGIYLKHTNEVYNNTVLALGGGMSIKTRPDVGEAVFINNIATGRSHYGTAIRSNNGDYPIGEDFVPLAGSGAIDAGRAVPPHTDGYLGSAPDIGAYEYGADVWQPGAEISDHGGGPITAVTDLDGGAEGLAERGPALTPNVPNPFNTHTALGFRVGRQVESSAAISIYNLLGQVVREYPIAPGVTEGQIVWDGRDQQGRVQASGIYLVALGAAGQRVFRRVALLR